MITLLDLILTLEINWSSIAISKNSQITWKMICDYPNGIPLPSGKLLPWDEIGVSCNPNITWEIVTANPHGPPGAIGWEWNVSGLSGNKSIGIEVMKENIEGPKIDGVVTDGWDLMLFLTKECVEMELLEMFPKSALKIYAKAISLNPNLTCEFIEKYFDIGFDWFLVSSNPGIYWEDVVAYRHFPWDLEGLSVNPNITWDIICENLHIKFKKSKGSPKTNVWSGRGFSYNPNLTLEIIIANPHGPPGARGWLWDWYIISGNDSITPQMIIDHPELPWEKKGLSWNRNLTPKLVKEHLSTFNIEWDWDVIAINSMDAPYYSSDDYKEDLATEIAEIIFDELVIEVKRRGLLGY